MSRATMMAALLGMGLAVPDSTAAPAAAETSAVIAEEIPAKGDPAATAPLPGAPEEIMGAPFTVESVDRANRSLVVRSPDGLRTTIQVAPAAQGLESVGRGDRITLDYYQASLVSLGGSPRGTAAGGAATPTRANAPVLGAAGGRQLTQKAHVTGVDGQNGTLEITTRDGEPHTLVVRDPAARMRLQSLAEGDEVTVTYTEAVAVGVHPREGT
jgi:hypothetical protein